MVGTSNQSVPESWPLIHGIVQDMTPRGGHWTARSAWNCYRQSSGRAGIELGGMMRMMDGWMMMIEKMMIKKKNSNNNKMIMMLLMLMDDDEEDEEDDDEEA